MLHQRNSMESPESIWQTAKYSDHVRTAAANDDNMAERLWQLS